MGRTLVVTVGVVALVVLVATLTAGDDSPDVASGDAAFVMCQEFLKENLAAPTTAKFPGLRDATIRSTGDQSWHVTSHVDAENTFGATLRSDWDCDVTYRGDDQWRGRAALR